VVAGGDPEPCVAVDDARRRRGDADVGEERDGEAAPTAGPSIAATTGLRQLTML